MPDPSLKITVLGSGTSVGVPTIGCGCSVCTSTDPRDNRLRPSILVSYGGHNVLIDTTPDFRTQALRAKIEHVDAVIFTHSHADHIMGLDMLFLDALRYKPHPTHSTVDRSIKTAEKLAPRRAFFTHICHDLAHERAESLLPANIRLAYDGLEIHVA